MRFLKKYLPGASSIQDEQHTGWLKYYLAQHPYIWHFNKYSVARGVAVGLFVAAIPLPLQMLLAICLSILCRGNVPVAVVATWVTNPFTTIPFVFGIYKVGEWVLGKQEALPTLHEFNWDINHIAALWHYLEAWAASLGKAFFVGLPIVAVGLAIFGYCFVMIAWRIYILVQVFYRAKKSRKGNR